LLQEEVEDIFSDWVRMLIKSDIRINADINDVFWNISFKKRPAVKGYWNIFSEWRHNLKEPAKPMSDWEILERKKNAQNLSKKMKKKDKEVFLDQEVYFGDWRQNLVPKRRPQKRRRVLEQEDHLMIWSKVFDEKRKSRGRKRKAKKSPEQEDFFEDWRQNLEPKSKRQLKRENRNLFQEDFFEDYRKNCVERNPKSGKPPRIPKSTPEQEDLFEDWRSNFMVKSKRQAMTDLRELYQEDYFLVWRQVFLDPTQKSPKLKAVNGKLEQEDYFMTWRKNLDPTGIKSVSGKTRDLSPEVIFAEWRPMILDREGRHRRRSIDELEDDDDVVIVSSPFKKIKQDFQAKKRACGKSMAYKFGRVYQGMKRNFLISLGSTKMKDNFDFWSSESTVQSLIDSRKEFCELRFEMRQQRQLNREINAVIAPESWFEDWRWNLDADRIVVKRRASDPIKVSPEKIFSDWRRISLDLHQSTPATDTFNEWMRNLKDRVKKRKPKPHPSEAAASSEMKSKLSSSSPTSKSSSSSKVGGVVALPNFSSLLFRSKKSGKKDSKSLKHPQNGKASTEKHTMRLMAKCHAKQPFGRGRN